MIRLREENEYLKAENAVIKKEIALREEKDEGATQGEKAALVKELREEGHSLSFLLKAMGFHHGTA